MSCWAIHKVPRAVCATDQEPQLVSRLSWVVLITHSSGGTRLGLASAQWFVLKLCCHTLDYGVREISHWQSLGEREREIYAGRSCIVLNLGLWEGFLGVKIRTELGLEHDFLL